jgi:CRP-like cAMP-binding protein
MIYCLAVSATDVRKLKDEAARAVEKGKWKKAAELYDEIARLAPDDTGALHRGGEAYRKLGRVDDAVGRFEREAALYARQGFLIKSIAICKLILEIDPSHTQTQETLAHLYAQQKAEQAPSTKPPAAAPKKPRAQPLEAMTLSQLIRNSRPVAPHVVEMPIEEEPDFDNGPPPIIGGPPALPRTPLFSALGERELRWLIENVTLRRKPRGETIFGEGEPGDSIFVIAHGEVQVLRDGREIARLGEGAFFGEIAILTNHPRSATVVATHDAELIEITRETISDLIDVSPGTLSVLLRFLRERLCDTLMTTSPMFGSFAFPDRKALIERFRFLEVEPDQVVIAEGERALGLYIVAAGRCRVTQGPTEIAELLPGDLCGEMSLLLRKPASATVRTASKCYLLQLPREAWAEIIVTHPQVLEYASEVADSRQARLL